MKEIESAIDNDNSEVSITPFTKKIRDLNKGITIHYGNNVNSYTMDYHGMGTRSWSSLLTFKSFILQHEKLARTSETHLHPDAQKRLYHQISEMPGQKIISTHSPYIASTANLFELRNIYKTMDKVLCGCLDIETLDKKDIRALRQKVINTKGEIIFAKALILFEGETEEQALPIFAEKYFNCNPLSLGLEFVGVGGCGNYYPFIYMAERFNIPWYIFSDGEISTKTKLLKAYNKALDEKKEDLKDIKNIFVIDNNADFEQMSLDDNYDLEIIDCLKELLGDKCIENFYSQHDRKPEINVTTADICKGCGRPIIKKELTDYSGVTGLKMVLNKMMSNNKTNFAPLIAEKIINCDKGLPPLVVQLFDKIKEDLRLCL